MVTNDGATILKSIALDNAAAKVLDNAAAKVLVNISKIQDDEVGDGTTNVAVLSAGLLREGGYLVNQKIHPQTIIEGYRIASAAALKTSEERATNRCSSDSERFRKDLVSIARTTLSSKVLAQDRDYFANLATDAVLRIRGSTNLTHIQVTRKAGGKLSDSRSRLLREPHRRSRRQAVRVKIETTWRTSPPMLCSSTDLTHIQVTKKAGGKPSESYLDSGFILKKKSGVSQPERLENANILVANASMDTDKVRFFEADDEDRAAVDEQSKVYPLLGRLLDPHCLPGARYRNSDILYTIPA